MPNIVAPDQPLLNLGLIGWDAAGHGLFPAAAPTGDRDRPNSRKPNS
ncbi:hypothetical protein H6G52_02435 [Limnothrix sp. FACHB-881]|nr:hypothetical protein [Limnothrix sp. FACHB-881]MBD2634207.1 hypothetical protein [Limnothrix sp. FACHB-881]